MKQIVLFLWAVLLVGCGIRITPAPDQWQSSVQGVDITWKYTAPGALGKFENLAYSGRAKFILTGRTCVIEIDPLQFANRNDLDITAAHEAGHCLQARYVLPGVSRPDLGSYYTSGAEGFAQSYAMLYLKTCGHSLKPLGWADERIPTCDQAPDPHLVKGDEKP